jgi:hypothetical protein
MNAVRVEMTVVWLYSQGKMVSAIHSAARHPEIMKMAVFI